MNGVAVLGLKSVINAAAGLIYPTMLRASGVGWAVGMGAVGSVIWVNLAGILIGSGVPIQALFITLAVLMMMGAIAWVVAVRRCAAIDVIRTGWGDQAAAPDAGMSTS